MGSRHHSLDLSEIADVTDMLNGFQQHNSCRIVVEVSVEVVDQVPGIVLVAKAYEGDPALLGAKPLGSVSVKCSTMNLKAWNSALIHVMYALDFQLALNELGHAAPQKA